MKRFLFFTAVAVVLAVSCRNEMREDIDRSGSARYERILSVGVADEEPESKVGFDEANAFYWHLGDKVGVQTSAGFKEMILQDEYAGMNSGVFEGSFEEDMMTYVIYPYGNDHVVSGETLTYVLPSSYAYTSIEEGSNSFNPPMLGRIDGDNASLNHLASFFKIYVAGIPAGGDDMEFVLTADKRITGAFTADLTAEYPVISTDDSEGNTVTITFGNTEPAANGVFYVPAPLGTYGSITAEIRDGGTSLFAKTWENQTVSRKTPKRGNAVNEYVAEIEGVPYKTLQEAFDAVDGQTITLVADVTQNGPLVLASGKTAVFDMNGRKVSGIATSASASRLIEVKSGADLFIKNGTLDFAATTPDTEWGGEGQAPYPGYANNTISNSGTLTIENAVVENRTSKGGASYVIDNYVGAKLVINDGSVITQSGGDIAIRMFNASSGAIDVTVNGGTITGNRAVWIQLASTDSSVAPVMNLTVTGGTLNTTDNTYYMSVYSYSYGNDMKNVKIDVSGGTFNGDIALTGGKNKTNIETAIITGGTISDIYSYGDYAKAVETIKIYGGTFYYDPTDYIAAGRAVVDNGDGSYTVVVQPS